MNGLWLSKTATKTLVSR